MKVWKKIIHAAIQTYSKKLKLITGSLKDVKEIKSLESYNDLTKMLEYQNIPFVEFTPSIPSWCEAHKNKKNYI